MNPDFCPYYNCRANFFAAVAPGEHNIHRELHNSIKERRPGTDWFSEQSLDSLGDLLVSMTRYRPEDRPSAADVLRHPWFRSNFSCQSQAWPRGAV